MTKSKVSLCYCNKEDGITVGNLPHKISRICSLFLISGGNFHVFNFCCLAEPRNFFTIETFANYGSLFSCMWEEPRHTSSH